VELLSALLTLAAAVASQPPDVVLRVSIGEKDHQTYRSLPFDVPAGVSRITVAYSYTGRDQGTTIDAGLSGPEGFRGWSGGNKKTFTVSAVDTTPSYLPGAITPGRWSVLLGIPHIRAGNRSELTASIYFDRVEAAPIVEQSSGWYRGDLHMHSGHSDGSCSSQKGARVPCPLFLTLQAAADRGLDFVAVTEHNTVSHVQELRALQPYFDRMVLIPGMEVTTFQGHANAFGVVKPVEFTKGWPVILNSLAEDGAIVSINHPGAPSGEICMGCGWTATVDPARFHAVEAVNGADPDTPVSGMPFWHRLLNQGLRPTGIGGSDNHDALLESSSLGRSRIGAPTTVVYAQSLSEEGIQEGLRSGNVFIDVQGTRDRMLEMSASAGNATVSMGGELTLPKGREAAFTVRVRGVDGARIEWVRDGELLHGGDSASYIERSDGARHWIRVNVRDAQGKLLLVGNPIYLNRH
jgi:hypothetical protein